MVIGLVVVYAQWWSWVWRWTAILPLCLFACGAGPGPAECPARSSYHWLDLAVLLALALSCWVGAGGLVYDEYDHDRFHANNYALEYLTWMSRNAR